MYVNLQDGYQLLRVFNRHRLNNALKVFAGYFLSNIVRNPKVFGQPLSVSLEPTTACNLSCPQCPSGLKKFSRPTGNLKKELYHTIIDEVSKKTGLLTLYFQGEPYINPNFFEMVKYAGERKMYTSTSTNAHFLTDDLAKKTVNSKLNRLIISVDGTDQESYEKYRVGGNLEKVLEGTRRLVKWKQRLNSATPVIIFQFIVFKNNEHQIKDIQRIGKELGVDKVAIKTAQIYDFESDTDWIPDDGQYARYKVVNGTWNIKNKLANKCSRIWKSTVITWDGRVIPCCFDKDAQHEFGKMQEGIEFSQIWNNPAYNQFRKSILTSRKSNEICKNCTEGTKVWS